MNQIKRPNLFCTRSLRISLLVGVVLSVSNLSAQGHDDHDHDHDHDHAVAQGTASDAGDDHDEHDHNDEHGVIRLEARDLLDFGIEFGVAGPGTIHEELRLPGEIRMNENTMAHVSPRFAGVVKDINRRLGEVVRRGEVLAKLESNETLRPFDLVAPLDGTIVGFHITPGESLDAGEAAFTISDTSTVWADIKVYQRDLPQLKSGQNVRISAGHHYPDVNGRISYLGPVVDEATRTGLARIVLNNPEGIYRPGLFVVGNVLLEAENHEVVLPLTAIHALDGRDVVYVESEDGDGFEAREVMVGHRDSVSAQISRGIRPGERYVAIGGFFLKADSQKENFGDGHDH
jgi:cobalt-zinc-cadmium efflux system membrane fusion protein